MEKEQIIKRLSIIKFLYKTGVEQSKQSEATSFFSILSFHDSIDMFLNLAAEKIGMEKTGNIFFMDYFKKIPEIALRESMQKLNTRRNNLKHNGVTPGKSDIETSRVNVTDFFEQNTPILFGLEFSEVSLFDLVTYEKTKSRLKNAQQNLDHPKIDDCIEEVSIAFNELLYEYKEKNGVYDSPIKTPFNFVEHISVDSAHRYEFEAQFTPKVLDAIEKINKNFQYLNNALDIISLGIDYRKFTKFKVLTPIVHRFPGGEFKCEIFGKRDWSINNCQFLIDFVLESAFKLQEFDFDYEALGLDTAILTILDKPLGDN